MQNPKHVESEDHAAAEAEARAALDRQARERNALSAREFVSDRDRLEDAWARSRERGARDEGW